MTVKAYGAHAGDRPLEFMNITWRVPPCAHGVKIDSAYCGVRHSDIHQVRAEWPKIFFALPVIREVFEKFPK
jgi:uncharacterized zinc-type alcohol dehydrogenase-like protein